MSSPLDRLGRKLVLIGGLVLGPLIILPALGLALLGLLFASGDGFLCSTAECRAGLLFVIALPAIGVVVAVIITIRRRFVAEPSRS